jgi:CubicO group peptidase (beta-lactamase class C family)
MSDFARTLALIREGIERGLHPGAQVYASLEGEPVLDATFGEARPGVPMTTDTLTLWMSACKPITAIAIAQQWECGRLDLDAPVAAYLPEFAQNGKERVTIRHVLTHTGGFPATPFVYPADPWDVIIEKLCAMPLAAGWTPGDKAGYHVHSGWFVLGELVQRAVKEPLPQYLRRHIFEPLGMRDSWIGMPTERFHAYGDRLSVMMNTASSPPQPLGWHGERWVTASRPSGNGYGPARELARFYEAMLDGGASPDGVRILEPETVELFTARHREGMFDRGFNHVMDWGLGFILDAKRHGFTHMPYGYGAHASDETFGHSGYQSSTAFADPAHSLAIALVFNGCPGEVAHQQRAHAVLTSLYEDLGLADPR